MEGQRDKYAVNGAEHRDHSRYSVDEDAVLLFAGHGKLQPGRIVDLSQEGCRVRTKERFPVRSSWPVEVSFKVNGVVFRFSGVLQWTDGGNLMGIRFVNINPQRMVVLANLISAMEAGAAARSETLNRLIVERGATEPTEHIGEFQMDDQSPIERSAGAAGQQQEPVPADALAASGSEPRVDSAAGRRDRRAGARHEVDNSASILLVNVGSTLRGRILDLSLSGCRIRTHERFPVGIYTRVEAEFRLEGLPFRLGGVIQAIHDRHTVGIRFLDLSERKRQQVQDLIGEIETTHAAQASAVAAVAESRV